MTRLVFSWRLAVGAIAIVGMLLSQRAAAQVTTGSISGVVVDPTGAIVLGANVTVRDVGTNSTRTVKTDSSGLYLVLDLPVGQYEETVRMAGFKTVMKTGITLSVGVANVQNFTLAVGSQEQTVQVHATAAQVQTSSSELSTLVNPQQVEDLPLNGRNFEQLILLAPGVAQVTTGGNNAFYGRADAYSISGARPVGQAILLDGANIQNYWAHGSGSSAMGTTLGVEGMGEFQTLTNTYSAEFGGTGSAINIASKSGTNQLHGTAYEYLRNSKFDSRNYFDQLTGPPPFRRNQYGASLGGPIRRDKTFFFANYEGIAELNAETGITTVPAANLPCQAAGCQLLSLYPAPNWPSTSGEAANTGQLSSVGYMPINENYLLARLDHELSSKDTLFGRVVVDRGQLTDPTPDRSMNGNVNGWPETDRSRNLYFTLEEKRVVRPNLVNVARLSFTRMDEGSYCPGSGYLNDYPGTGQPDAIVSFLGVATQPIGPSIVCPTDVEQDKFTPEDQVYWSHGAHDIRFGGYVRPEHTNWNSLVAGGDMWNFDGVTGLANAGMPGSAQVAVGVIPGGANGLRDFRDIEFAAYIQDNWKVRKNFELNVGLRYQPTTIAVPTGGVDNTILNLLTAPACPPSNITCDYTQVAQVFSSNPSLRNLDPRIGFAYSPFGEKTSIRAGFGIFHSVLETRDYAASYELSPPFISGVSPGPTWPNAFTGFYIYSPSQSEGMSYYNTHTPYIMQYNLNIQRELSSGMVFAISYVGSRGVHLKVLEDENHPLATKLASGVWQFIPGQYVNNNLSYFIEDIPEGSSNYNAFELSATGKVTNYLQLQLFYTFSKMLDYSSGDTTSMQSSQGDNYLDNPYDLRYDYGLSSFNMRNNFTGNLLFALPFHGNQWVEGYQLSLIASMHSGAPYSADIGYDVIGDSSPEVMERPNVVGNPNVGGQVAANPTCVAPASVHTAQEWYNPCAFALPPAYQLGDERRNSLIGPGFQDVDFAVQKTTSVSERLKLQLRAEFFNIPNHADFSTPNTNVFIAGEPGVTQTEDVPDTTYTSRQIQFALKFLF